MPSSHWTRRRTGGALGRRWPPRRPSPPVAAAVELPRGRRPRRDRRRPTHRPRSHRRRRRRRRRSRRPRPSTAYAVPRCRRRSRVRCASSSPATRRRWPPATACWRGRTSHPDVAEVTVAGPPACGFVRGRSQRRRRGPPGSSGVRRPGRGTTAGDAAAVCSPTSSSAWSRCATSTTGPGTTREGRLRHDDPRFAERLIADYDAATTAFEAAGVARVLWVPPPLPALAGCSTPLAIDALRRGAGRGGRRGTPAGPPSSTCAAGWRASRTPPDRPDGLHWSPDGAARLASDFLGPVVVAAADRRSSARRPAWSSGASTRRTSGTRSSSSRPPRGASASSCTSTAAPSRRRARQPRGRAWLAELHPDVTVVEVVHDLPHRLRRRGAVAALDRAVPRPLAAARPGPTSCAPATPTSPSWRGASAPSQSSSTPSGRTCRSARR